MKFTSCSRFSRPLALAAGGLAIIALALQPAPALGAKSQPKSAASQTAATTRPVWTNVDPKATEEFLPDPGKGKAWKMVFDDEFDGNALDETKWVYRPDGKRKDGWWSRKAVALDGLGHLVISATREDDKVLSGCIVTTGKFEHAFGYWATRVKFQKQPGHWSAFWLQCGGTNRVGDEGRDGTEIDIFEKPWLDDSIQHTLHWDGYGKDHKSAGLRTTVPGPLEGWHTVGLWWTKDQYVFYVDGKETWRTSAGGVSQVPEYIMLSNEVGKWAGDIAKAQLPDCFMVDYVRVYDLVDAGAAKGP